MGFDASGNFDRTNGRVDGPDVWKDDATSIKTIRSDYHDTHDNDLAQGLSLTILKDGRSVITANIPFNGKRITNLADPVDPQDAATKHSSEAIRNFNTGVTLTGNSTGTTPNFTSTAFLGFAEADMSIVARKADPLAVPPTLNRIAFNSQADGKGSDLIVIRDDGTLIGTNGSLFKITVVTTTPPAGTFPAGTFAFDKDTKYAMVEVLAGGGGGGSGLSAAARAASGSGGGAGAYARKFFPVEGLTVVNGVKTGAIAIGAAGAASANTNGAAGGTGGTSSWTDAVNTITCTGGTGGPSTAQVNSLSTVYGGPGGTATGGDINVDGTPGEACFSLGVNVLVNGVAGMARSGNGASSQYGAGGLSAGCSSSTTGGANAVGNGAAGRGAGGGGGGGVNSASGANGGAGTAGMVIVKEYR